MELAVLDEVEGLLVQQLVMCEDANLPLKLQPLFVVQPLYMEHVKHLPEHIKLLAHHYQLQSLQEEVAGYFSHMNLPLKLQPLCVVQPL